MIFVNFRYVDVARPWYSSMKKKKKKKPVNVSRISSLSLALLSWILCLHLSSLLTSHERNEKARGTARALLTAGKVFLPEGPDALPIRVLAMFTAICHRFSRMFD
jgi:hypothetical protein